jgi:hypothetical protein
MVPTDVKSLPLV